MKIEIRLSSNELEMVENIFNPINVFAKEIADSEDDMTETFSMIKRNAKAGYAAEHKTYTCVLKQDENGEYLISWNLKNLFIEIVSEFGNKIAKLFVSIARPIIELCKDPIMNRINELNDNTDEERIAIVGKEAIPYINAWRSNKAIEHDKAIMFDLKNYVENHEANDAIEHLTTVLNNEQNTLKYNKAFFIKLYEELESKCDDEVLKDLCNRAIDRLEEA